VPCFESIHECVQWAGCGWIGRGCGPCRALRKKIKISLSGRVVVWSRDCGRGRGHGADLLVWAVGDGGRGRGRGIMWSPYSMGGSGVPGWSVHVSPIIAHVRA